MKIIPFDPTEPPPQGALEEQELPVFTRLNILENFQLAHSKRLEKLESVIVDIDSEFDKRRSILKLRRDMQFIIKYMNEINQTLMKMEAE